MQNDWREDQNENVYEMSVAHGGAGFWVRRTTWGNTCARVVRIGETAGPAPYFGSPSVLMDVYSLDGELRDPMAWLNTAGTYKTWRRIDPPEWAASVKLRPLDDPSLDLALDAIDKKRHKGRWAPKSKPPVERIWLEVPYRNRRSAKNIGAKWDGEQEQWWLPADKAGAIADARKRGFLPKEGGGELKPKSPTEKVWLDCPYEKRLSAKKLGARWSPEDRKWWLPADDASAIAEAQELGLISSASRTDPDR